MIVATAVALEANGRKVRLCHTFWSSGGDHEPGSPSKQQSFQQTRIEPCQLAQDLRKPTRRGSTICQEGIMFSIRLMSEG